jgi:hypothetical protein
MKTLWLALIPSLAMTTLAFADEAAVSKPPNCVSPRDIDTTTPISDREIVFKMRNGKTWLNTLPTNCPGLKFEGGFSWEIHGDTICANSQIFRVLRRGSVCTLGAFTPYTPEKPAQD